MHKPPDSIESLKEAYEQMKVSLDLANVGLSHIGFNGDILWANPFYLKFIGYTKEELPGLNIRHFTRTEHLPRSMKALERLRNGELESFEFDRVYLCRDGTFNWGHVLATVHKDKQGKPQYVVSVTHDISKRKEFENLLNLMLKAIPSLVSYIDKDLTYKFVNQSYEKWFGIPYQEVVGKKLVEVIGKEAFTQANAHVARVLKGEYVEYERRLDYQYGGSRDVHVTFIPDFNPIGDVAGFVVVVSDVTELKDSEEIEDHDHKRLLDAAKMSVLDAMANGVSHQINEPLQALNIKLDKMFESLGPGDENLKYDLTKIKESTFRISKIVKGLRSFSKKDNEDPIGEHNLAMIIEDATAFCRDHLRNNEIDLFIEDATNIKLKCNHAQLSRVILNLLTNSCDAIKNLSARWIKISVTAEPNRILIGVTDSGPGLSTEVVTNLLSPFFTTKKSPKSSGLGLSDTRGIVEKYGGKLIYDSSSVNTRFVIELPREQNCVIVDVK